MNLSITEILLKSRILKGFTSWFDFVLPEEQDTNLFSVFLKGASGSFLLKVAFTAFNLIISLILARILGVGEYGTYVYVMSWILLLGIPAGLGLDKVMLRFIATYNRQGEWGKIKGLIRYSNIAVIAVSVAIFFLVYLSMQFLINDKTSSNVYIPLLIAMILLPLNSLLARQESALRGFQWIISGQISTSLIRPLLYILFIGAAWQLARNNVNVPFIISLNVIATSMALIVAGYLLYRVIPKDIENSYTSYEPRVWIRSAFPLMLMGGMYMINGQADILMLGSMRSTELSGIYQIADRGAGLILLFLSAVIASFAPLIAHLYAGKDMEKLQRMVTRVSRLTLLLSLPVAVIMVFFGKWILGIFGPGFVEGYTALVILSFSQLVNISAGPVANILMMTGHERDAAMGVGISSLFNVILNVLFIPLWGLAGAAIATGSSTIIWNLIFIWFVRQRIDIHPTVFGIVSFGGSK